MTSDKKDYSDLIPEYHHGLLDFQKEALFKKELSRNSGLQEELKEFTEFQELYQKLDTDEPQASNSQFDAILLAIDREQQQKQSYSQKSPHLPAPTNGLITLWNFLKESSAVPWGMALVQTVVIVVLLFSGEKPAQYRTLSRTSDNETALTGVSFNVVFTKTAKEEEIRKLLLGLGATIISGPSPQGLYIISISSGETTAQAAQTLHSSTIVGFSERAY